MGLRRDERGQSVQVGAAILLGFLVVAMTLYQAQVVPSQNAEIEADHSQAVQSDLQDVRNAVAEAGTSEASESRQVTLGTRYPARALFVNPPPARGVLRTVDAGNVSIANAELADGATYGDAAEDLLADGHPTAHLAYAPQYAEYRNPPTTIVEHALAYSAFADGSTGSLSSQPVVRGDDVTLTLLTGNLSAQGSRSISVSARTVSGPTGTIPIEPATDGQPIEFELPVATADAWNATIGSTYATGQPDARVASYDTGSGDATGASTATTTGNPTATTTGTMTVELRKDRYELQFALVSVGDQPRRTDRYDVGAGDGEAYAVSWRDPSGQSGVNDSRCDGERCVVTGSSVDLAAGTAPVADGATVEYVLENRSLASLSTASGTTDAGGVHEQTVQIDASAEDGDVVRAYASSGGSGDRIALEIDR